MTTFKAEFDEINSAFTDYDLHQKEVYNDLDNARLGCLYNELRDLVIDMLTYIEQNNKNMKEFIVEYRGYKLKVEINSALTSNIKKYPYIKGTCNSISFVKSGYYGSYQDILDEFMKVVDKEYEEETRNESLAFRD